MSDTDRPYETIRRAILSLDLAPGERLSERGLEELAGASRTPIRAALMRLHAEGLTRRDGRAWQVSPLDLAELRAVSEFREAVETAAARLAAARATDDEIADLRLVVTELAESDDEEHGVRAGADFHTVLAGLARNPFLRSAVADAMTRLARTRFLDVRTPASRLHARAEHEAIVDALAAGDGEAAANLVATHIRGTTARLLEALTAERGRLRGHGQAIVDTAAR